MNLSDPKELAPLLEAFLLASGKPQTLERLFELFEEAERPDSSVFKKALALLAKSCEGRAFELKEVASGYRLQVRECYAPWVGRLWEERPQRYSRAMLETLALIAYRQPITRGEIEDIRGVAVNSQIIKTLQEREWIRVVGHRDVPGKPAMLATTKAFLDHFNLKGLDDLPTLAALRELEPLPLADLDDDLPPPAGLQARADAELEAAAEPAPRDETSFRSLLAELDGMEQGLKTDFDDLPERPEAPEQAALAEPFALPESEPVPEPEPEPEPVPRVSAVADTPPALDAEAEEQAALARAIAEEALERMRD